MVRYLIAAVFIVSALAGSSVDPLHAREPPDHYRAVRSTVVALDLTTRHTTTLSEHRNCTLTLLDLRDGVLLGVEFEGPGISRMVGLSSKSGEALWRLRTDTETWRHFFERQFPRERRGDCFFSFPDSNFAKPPLGGRTPFCGLARDNLAGIDIHSGQVLWKIAPPHHYDNRFAWRSIFGLRDHVAAVRRGRVIIVNRVDGQIVLDLKPKAPAHFYRIMKPVETDEYILLAFDDGATEELVRWSKRTGKVEQRFKPPWSVGFIAATDDLLLTKHGCIHARDIHDLERVLWREKMGPQCGLCSGAVVWGQYLVMRSSKMAIIDLRDGSGFSLFHQPPSRQIGFANHLWTVQNDMLYTVSSSGILRWSKQQVQSRGSTTAGSVFWSPKAEATESKGRPYFVDCLMGNGVAHLVLVYEWEPVF